MQSYCFSLVYFSGRRAFQGTEKCCEVERFAAETDQNQTKPLDQTMPICSNGCSSAKKIVHWQAKDRSTWIETWREM